jgi:hypothetical protein
MFGDGGHSVALVDVLSLITPPAQPSGVGTLDEWRLVERELGLVLPTDYREFVFAYGHDRLAGMYSVYNPFVTHLGRRYIERVRDVCQSEADFRVDFPERVPYPVWPEPGGLFPWAGDDNGNEYFWLTAGPPDEWPVVSNAPRGRGYREQGGTMTEYLAGVLRGEIRPLISDFPTPQDMVFDSY